MAMFESRHLGSGGDKSWMGSRDGRSVAESGTLDVDAFADLAENRVVKSGTPVSSDAEGVLTPYTGGEGQALRGFLVNDENLDETGVVAVLWRGRIVVENLPVEGFTVPSEPTHFVWA